jgi:hypothetical protein
VYVIYLLVCFPEILARRISYFVFLLQVNQKQHLQRSNLEGKLIVYSYVMGVQAIYSNISLGIGNKGNNKITELEQSYKTHNYINRQNQSTTGKL